MIDSKSKIIDYFNSGIKADKDFRIGIEHEKFLFDVNTNKRIDYKKILEMFAALTEFGWAPIKEKNNIIGLSKDCLLYTSPSPRDRTRSRMPSSA